MKRVFPALAAVTVVVAAVVLGPTSPASAAGQCNPTSVTAEFNPPITFAVRQVAVQDLRIDGAVCTESGNPDVTSMKLTGAGSGVLTCSQLNQASGRATVDWTTLSGANLRSQADWSLAVVAGVWVFTGTFTSGTFSGQGFTYAAEVGTHPLECLSGIEKNNGTGLFVIT
ncbi:hypothetical protein [Saccharothrix obliqua]|uniref:hypothetical protein n=1 Tax=Saccharothrix obliqua TaxID=2861747 RepID=UPI001C5F089A|nr:hypothetical protein [Saccharothrix obliqua]MBW4718634.1 hypothetical protein [Saccharothrix obliqua]